jgi:pimeloyl-ACP methyl ester carboxylesterase
MTLDDTLGPPGQAAGRSASVDRIEPFRVQVSDAALSDLHRRIDATRLPPVSPAEPWSDGPPVDYIRALLDYWRDGFDWRRQERLINELPQFRELRGTDGVHFVHARSAEPAAFPLLLLHGWPGSFWEFHRIVPLLIDPAAHGADPGDAFDVVAPSLPGYGWSDPPVRPGCDPAAIAMRFASLMANLGYQRFGAHGSDWGARISASMGVLVPDRVAGIHLSFPSFIAPPLDYDGAELGDSDRAAMQAGRAFGAERAAYLHLQSTRPQTPAYGLSDSPAGLAAWIAEKYWEWTDHGTELESMISPDDLLTIITTYWMTNSIGPSMWLYREHGRRPWVTTVPVPAGCAIFPCDTSPPVRAWVERFLDVQRWTEMPRGGHFGALEEPELLAAEIRAFFRPLRNG